MKTKAIILITILLMTGCPRPMVVEHSTHNAELGTPAQSADAGDLQIVENLSLNAIIGNWIRLDSEGEISKNRDSLLISKRGDEYVGTFNYQGVNRGIRLIEDGGALYLVATDGTRYKMGRTESTRGKAFNGIWLALDDIDLGNFQREDILKQLEGQ